MMSKKLGIEEWSKRQRIWLHPTSSLGFNGHDKRDAFRRRSLLKGLTGSKAGGI
jgi:hypothetical protein